MRNRLLVILIVVFVIIFAICFYFLKKNEDSIRNYSKFRLMIGEKQFINRELTQLEKQKLKLALNQSQMRYKDTLGDIFIYNDEFFKSKKPLFMVLTARILDSTSNK